MRYISTRGHGGSLSFNDALLAGLAPDGGLYVPEYYPQISWDDVLAMRGWSYHEIALHVLKLFVGEDISDEALRDIIWRSYEPQLFTSTDVVTIRPMAHRFGLLELSNGPTLAFKDLALQLVTNLMDYVLRERDERITLLGATSGDTGSAAEMAVLGRERLRIVMLSPYGRMTKFQQMQMYRIDDPAVFNLVPYSNFDDCQTAVKLVNGDADFKKRHSIGAVNSINWARIAAQVIYYVYGFTRVVRDESEILTVSVPSGNFGNALSAYVAGRMGLKMTIIVATNDNDVLHEFFKTGMYRVRKGSEVKKTHSPSMDIASASNFERLMFDCVERDPERLGVLWDELSVSGQFTFEHQLEYIHDGIAFCSGMARDDEVIGWIKLIFDAYGIIVDPHTAVGLKVGLELYGGDGLGPLLVAETAKPAKFEDAIYKAIGIRMGFPPICSHLKNRKDKLTPINESEPSAIAEEVKSFIEKYVN